MTGSEKKEMNPSWMEEIAQKFQGLSRSIKDFLYGLARHELEGEVKRQKIQLENAIMLYAFGDLLGIPLYHRYYALRLFPYFIPKIESWKRRMLRERDLTDMGGIDL